MAIVANLAENKPLDKSFRKVNRSAAAVLGSLTPQFTGEIALDTTTSILYMASSTASTSSWVPVSFVS
jgi:hypothetical protein